MGKQRETRVFRVKREEWGGMHENLRNKFEI